MIDPLAISVTSPDELVNIGEAFASSDRWAPYCEGLEPNSLARTTTAILLENQYRYLKSLDETTKMLQIGNWEKFAFPMIRAVFPNLIASEIASVQPMTTPSSLVFYMDYLYGTTKGAISAGTSVFDARTGPTGNETYSSDIVSQESATLSSNNIAHTLSRTPVRPGTVKIAGTSAGGAFVAADDGNGGFYIESGTETIGTGTVDYTTGAVALDLTNNITVATITYRYDGEAADNVPQIDIMFTSAPVMAAYYKLRGRWSLEAAQNMQAIYGLDAQAELTAVLGEALKHELDRKVINDLYAFAGGGTITWDKTVPGGVSYTEHKLSIIDAMVALNNKIFSATKRVQTNFIVSGLAVCDVLENLPGYQPFPGAMGTQGATGVIKAGQLRQWTIYKDPFLPTNKWIQGYKGNSFMDSGYVMAPYIPIFATPTVILDDFMGRKGVGSSVGFKTINNRFYGIGTLTGV